MKIYLLKKEFLAIWKWSSLAIVIHFVLFFYGESVRSANSIIEAPYLMFSGEFASAQSPLLETGYYWQNFWIITLILGALLAIVQIYPEIQNRTLQFLLHRPITRKKILDSKIITGLVVLIVSICLPFSFVIVVCLIPGNYAAPFYFEMTLKWFICVYFACCLYLGIFYCCLQEGKFLKWVVLFSIFTFYLLVSEVLIYLSVWLLAPMLISVAIIWYFAVLSSFQERDFS